MFGCSFSTRGFVDIQRNVEGTFWRLEKCSTEEKLCTWIHGREGPLGGGCSIANGMTIDFNVFFGVFYSIGPVVVVAESHRRANGAPIKLLLIFLAVACQQLRLCKTKRVRETEGFALKQWRNPVPYTTRLGLPLMAIRVGVVPIRGLGWHRYSSVMPYGSTYLLRR